MEKGEKKERARGVIGVFRFFRRLLSFISFFLVVSLLLPLKFPRISSKSGCLSGTIYSYAAP